MSLGKRGASDSGPCSGKSSLSSIDSLSWRAEVCLRVKVIHMSPFSFFLFPRSDFAVSMEVTSSSSVGLCYQKANGLASLKS